MTVVTYRLQKRTFQIEYLLDLYICLWTKGHFMIISLNKFSWKILKWYIKLLFCMRAKSVSYIMFNPYWENGLSHPPKPFYGAQLLHSLCMSVWIRHCVFVLWSLFIYGFYELESIGDIKTFLWNKNYLFKPQNILYLFSSSP